MLPSPNARLSWYSPGQLTAFQRPPRQLYPWLVDSASLTAKLLALSERHFRVEILRQVMAYPSLSERLVLGLDQRRLALIREVVLYGFDQPWVFARSVLPLSSLTGSLRRLRKQGSRPLGAFLFSQPHLVRGPIALAAINAHHGYVPAGLLKPDLVWGRRSVFSLTGKPLLVSEVFLHDLVQRLGACPESRLSEE